MRLWIDDVRPAPKGYVWCKSVGQTKQVIRACWLRHEEIEILDIDHDAGQYAFDGGDFIKILDWLELVANSNNYFIYLEPNDNIITDCKNMYEGKVIGG